jgi:hypothetical protein
LSFYHELERECAELEAENARLSVALQATFAEKERIRQLAVDYSCEADGLRMDLEMHQNMKLAREFESLLGTTSIPVAVKKIKALIEIVEAAKSLLVLCVNCGDFRNGITAYGIDEGEVWARKIITKLQQALAGLERGGE